MNFKSHLLCKVRRVTVENSNKALLALEVLSNFFAMFRCHKTCLPNDSCITAD